MRRHENNRVQQNDRDACSPDGDAIFQYGHRANDAIETVSIIGTGTDSGKYTDTG